MNDLAIVSLFITGGVLLMLIGVIIGKFLSMPVVINNYVNEEMFDFGDDDDDGFDEYDPDFNPEPTFSRNGDWHGK